MKQLQRMFILFVLFLPAVRSVGLNSANKFRNRIGHLFTLIRSISFLNDRTPDFLLSSFETVRENENHNFIFQAPSCFLVKVNSSVAFRSANSSAQIFSSASTQNSLS
jgi:hypothetical protein